MNLSPVQLSYEEHGSGTPLVLLHGFPLNRSIWKPLIPLLSDTARLILPDLRGHGQSPAPEGTYTMREMAEDVYQLLNRLGLDRVVLGGHSMGGYVALAFAQAYPKRLAGLALIASHPAADTLEKRQSRLVQARQVRSRGQAKLASQMLAALTPNPVVAAQVSDMILANPKQGIVGALLGMAEREDTTRALASIQVPALVVAGSEDRIVSPETAAEFIGFFPRGWMVEAPGAGHLPMMETPEIVAAALRDLIRRA